jgi:hypothetical protein
VQGFNGYAYGTHQLLVELDRVKVRQHRGCQETATAGGEGAGGGGCTWGGLMGTIQLRQHSKSVYATAEAVVWMLVGLTGVGECVVRQSVCLTVSQPASQPVGLSPRCGAACGHQHRSEL